jgi:uncharacterized protein (TIGR03435 family)
MLVRLVSSVIPTLRRCILSSSQNSRRHPQMTRAQTAGRAFLFLSTWIFLTTLATAQQPETTGPAFEVATIRLANRDDGRHWFGTRVEGHECTISAESLESLVGTAYGSSDDHGKSSVIVDHSAPKWIGSDQFDINARIDDAYLVGWDKLSYKQQMDIVRPMLRQLLEERFHLKLHSESRPTPVYALVQAKGGAHVKEVAAPAAVDGDKMEAQARWMRDNPGKAIPGGMMCTGDHCTANATKIANAVGQIGANAKTDRIVIDETGLTGYYDFVIPYPAQDDEHPMSTVEEALGMRFEKRTIPIQTWIIESAEKPSLDGASQPASPSH